LRSYVRQMLATTLCVQLAVVGRYQILDKRPGKLAGLFASLRARWAMQPTASPYRSAAILIPVLMPSP
jgi:hypothetical protein